MVFPADLLGKEGELRLLLFDPILAGLGNSDAGALIHQHSE